MLRFDNKSISSIVGRGSKNPPELITLVESALEENSAQINILQIP